MINLAVVAEIFPAGYRRSLARTPASGPECLTLRPFTARAHSDPGCPTPPHAAPVSVAAWTTQTPNFTTRCSSSFWLYKCAKITIENVLNNGCQIDLGSQSEGRTNNNFRIPDSSPGSQIASVSSLRFEFQIDVRRR